MVEKIALDFGTQALKDVGIAAGTGLAFVGLDYASRYAEKGFKRLKDWWGGYGRKNNISYDYKNISNKTNSAMNGTKRFRNYGYGSRYYYRRRYARRKAPTSLLYKYDCPIIVKWLQNTYIEGVLQDGTFNYMYKDNNGNTQTGTNPYLDLPTIGGSKIKDLLKEYNNARIKAIKLLWYPNVTGLGQAHSMPLHMAYIEYPAPTVPTAVTEYYDAMDKESKIITGTSPSTRYIKFYQKYADPITFQQYWAGARIVFPSFRTGIQYQHGTIIGSLVVRIYYQVKGRKI